VDCQNVGQRKEGHTAGSGEGRNRVALHTLRTPKAGV
jgi:hypothetical protein